MSTSSPHPPIQAASWLDRLILFSLHQKVLIYFLIIMAIGWGLMVAPFDWNLGGLPRFPLAADAIPDLGENQQIVFTDWPGRSPQDVENQITYPLAAALMGIPGVKTVRCYSMFGFSTIYVIFNEHVEFYWSRSRLLEKLSSLPPGTVPAGLQPTLGPDATALGQVFWYTLEGRDRDGQPTGGWDLHELRTIQDWYVRQALLAAPGVSEAASVGGFVQEYQVDVDPDLMRAYDVSLEEIMTAIGNANIDVGANTIEINKVEYVIRGLGFIKNIDDIRNTLVKITNGMPVLIDNIANLTLGPASRTGALDKNGREAVGGVVVARYGENPLVTIKNVKKKIKEISPGLPRKTLADGTVSQVTIVPFYDRSRLINETLGTLESALTLEILITILVIMIMLLHLGSSLLVSGLLPLAVLMCFAAMKIFRVDANIVALSGIAIAIGTMVDMGIVIMENIARHMNDAPPGQTRLETVFRATSEVGSAVLTAVATTVVSFLPVFTMVAAEGKLFRPLAFTKTFALLASIAVALVILPPLAQALYDSPFKKWKKSWILYELMIYLGAALAWYVSWPTGLVVGLIGAYHLVRPYVPEKYRQIIPLVTTVFTVAAVTLLLALIWAPLGLDKSLLENFTFIGLMVGALLVAYRLFMDYYANILHWCLEHKKLFLSAPLAVLVLGLTIWLGFPRLFGWLPTSIRTWGPASAIAHVFPGLSKEFMPPLDEGAFLLMPVTMPHASIGEAMEVLGKQDIRIQAVPEVESAVGKIGRADSPLDPAPVSMIETIINYYPEFLADAAGQTPKFKYDAEKVDYFRHRDGYPVQAPDGQPYLVQGSFIRDDNNQLIPDENGRPFRLWRNPLNPELNPEREYWAGIQKTDDIWTAIVEAASIPGTTTAPRLQPISARIVMLQSGINASMGVRISGPDLESIQQTALELETQLRQVVSIDPNTVVADRIIGKPYLEIRINRRTAAQYGLGIQQVQDVIEGAIGGLSATTTVEGRERYAVRVRYLRELRDNVEAIGEVLVPTPTGSHIPLRQVADIEYVTGPQMIKNENTFLVGYVLFDKKAGYSDVDVVNHAQTYLNRQMDQGQLIMPAGVSLSFTGSYENQVRSEKTIMVILPLSLFIIFMILYLQLRSVSTAALVFTGIAVSWAGGFIMIWLYAQPWFLDFYVFGCNLRDVFQVRPFNLSVAVWVGFLALFGIATDDGVIMSTYLNSTFAEHEPVTVEDIRATTVAAGLKRIRPCLMTTATTILALLPVLSSTGRGADIMVPMAIPSFGGMAVGLISILVVPVTYCALKERQLIANPEAN
jgi:Cu(I)/Ag(I) efflux system membrane protein CusA/SilA